MARNNTLSNTHTSSSPTWAGVYRAAAVQVFCSLCGKPAVACCVRCGQAFCGDHAARADERCADCELAYSRTSRSISSAATVVTGLVTLGGTVAAGWFSIPLAGVVAGLSLFTGWLVSVASHKIARSHFMAKRAASSALLDGASFKIAPALEEEPGRGKRMIRHWAHRNRGELPSIPMWQRTYGVG